MSPSESRLRFRSWREGFGESVVQILREYAEALIIAVIVALLLRAFVLAVYKIPTTSMSPTLKVGDFIMALRMPYSFSFAFKEHKVRWLPKRGQVIVFRCPQNPSMSCVKRVVGLPGDRVQMIKKRLFLNGKRADYARGDLELLSDYPQRSALAVVNETLQGHTRPIVISRSQENSSYGPVIVPPGHVFVLGDDRDSGDDSRFWGPVPIRQIEGRVFMIWMSLDWSQPVANGRLPTVRWKRVFERLH